jgi:enoyl-CoA hydratase/carnithine racemase
MMGLVAKVVPAAELKRRRRNSPNGWRRNPPAAIGATKALVYQAATARPSAARCRGEEDHRLHAARGLPRRVKKFTSKSK